jgi:hypothetical protein
MPRAQKTPFSITLKEEQNGLSRKGTTHTDLSERRSEYRACVRLRKSKQEDRSDAVERAGFDEDPEDIESGFADTVPSRVPFAASGFPESIADHQCCSELRCYREAPRRSQPIVDPRDEDGFGWREVRQIGEASIAGDWFTKMMRPSSQARIGKLGNS